MCRIGAILSACGVAWCDLFAGLIRSLYQFAHCQGHSHLVICGVESRVLLYEHFCFGVLDPAVGAGG
jgi:hypothetical protein